MELGAFSISLAVKDLQASRAFYEKFGFTAFGGDPSQNWLILKNGHHVIGLFQGMFEKNILTFTQAFRVSPAFVEKWVVLGGGDTRRRQIREIAGAQRARPRSSASPSEPRYSFQ